MRKYVVLMIASLWIGVLAVGCNQTPTQVTPAVAPVVSPLAGNWTGEAKLATGSDLTKLANALSGDKMTGSSRLILQADGSGFLKVAKMPEQPVSWKQNGKKIILQVEGGKGDDKDTGSKTYVATLSEDGKSLTIDMGDVKVSLTKQSSDTQ